MSFVCPYPPQNNTGAWSYYPYGWLRMTLNTTVRQWTGMLWKYEA